MKGKIFVFRLLLPPSTFVVEFLFTLIHGFNMLMLAKIVEEPLGRQTVVEDALLCLLSTVRRPQIVPKYRNESKDMSCQDLPPTTLRQ